MHMHVAKRWQRDSVIQAPIMNVDLTLLLIACSWIYFIINVLLSIEKQQISRCTNIGTYAQQKQDHTTVTGRTVT